MVEFIKNYFEEIKNLLDKVSAEDTKKVTELIYNAYHDNKQIFIIGNGGSAATASHFACDLNKGTLSRVYDDDEKRFRVISMADNVAILTAYANDLSYDDIFSQQLRNLVNKGDLVIAITGSGNSKNIIKGVETAKKSGATTIGFLGFQGGKLKNMVDHHILVPTEHYGRIEDVHAILAHLISAYLGEMKRKKESV